jgi:hypothetical protein
VYAGCRRGITAGQYKGGNGPTRVTMDDKLVKETFDRISNTPLTSDGSTAFVTDILNRLGLKESVVNENLLEKEHVPVAKQRSVLQTHKYLADQLQARADARIESPKFINAPHKAPKKMIKRKIQFSDTLEDLNNENPNKKIKAGKKNLKTNFSLNEKILKTLSDGFEIKTLEIGVYELTVKNDPKRCYTVNLKANPSCTCPEFERIVKSRLNDRNTLICKHIPVMMLCLGFSYSSKLLRRFAYNATERMLVDLKTATFLHTNLDIADIKTKFENEMNPKLETPEKELPYFDPKKFYGQYKSYEEANLFINEQKERYPCKWFGLRYEEKRYVCTSALHATQDSKKLRQNLTQARPLVFLVHFTRIFLNKHTGRYSARDEKKYFHMKKDCVSSFGWDLKKFTNIKPPFDVDISRLSTDNRAFVKKTFPDYTFVEDFE